MQLEGVKAGIAEPQRRRTEPVTPGVALLLHHPVRQQRVDWASSPGPGCPPGPALADGARLGAALRAAAEAEGEASEQVELQCGVHAAQPAGIGGQRGPAPRLGDVHNVPGATIKDIGVQEQPVHPARCRSVEVTEHH